MAPFAFSSRRRSRPSRRAVRSSFISSESVSHSSVLPKATEETSGEPPHGFCDDAFALHGSRRHRQTGVNLTQLFVQFRNLFLLTVGGDTARHSTRQGDKLGDAHYVDSKRRHAQPSYPSTLVLSTWPPPAPATCPIRLAPRPRAIFAILSLSLPPRASLDKTYPCVPSPWPPPPSLLQEFFSRPRYRARGRCARDRRERRRDTDHRRSSSTDRTIRARARLIIARRPDLHAASRAVSSSSPRARDRGRRRSAGQHRVRLRARCSGALSRATVERA